MKFRTVVIALLVLLGTLVAPAAISKQQALADDGPCYRATLVVTYGFDDITWRVGVRCSTTSNYTFFIKSCEDIAGMTDPCSSEKETGYIKLTTNSTFYLYPHSDCDHDRDQNREYYRIRYHSTTGIWHSFDGDGGVLANVSCSIYT